MFMSLVKFLLVPDVLMHPEPGWFKSLWSQPQKKSPGKAPGAHDGGSLAPLSPVENTRIIPMY